ncbi:MAG TPA: KTSC domain-containing protein, partial [Pyrinomonadaceae bacterium]|nr:KTSC domain-containing protein [Pyrinomonadaceae bacterium]
MGLEKAWFEFRRVEIEEIAIQRLEEEKIVYTRGRIRPRSRNDVMLPDQATEIPRMKLTPVKSSMLRAVGYDRKVHELEVVFNSGDAYRYEKVP